MKRTHSYEIDYFKKTVTVTRKFMDAATQLNADEFALLTQFNDLGLRVLVKAAKRRKMPVDGKKPLLTYQMMMDFIALLDDAEDMQKEFDAIREASKSRRDRSQHVNAWFRSRFPQYDEVPEFDEDYHIIHNPNPAA